MGLKMVNFLRTLDVPAPGVYELSLIFEVLLSTGFYDVGIDIRSSTSVNIESYFFTSKRVSTFEVLSDPANVTPGLFRCDADLAFSAFAAGDLRWAAQVGALDGDLECVIGAEFTVPTMVENTGSKSLSNRGYGPVFCCCHGSCDEPSQADLNCRTPLPATIEAGMKAIVNVRATAPDRAGAFVLDITLLREWVGWFEHHGLAMAKRQIVVREAT